MMNQKVKRKGSRRGFTLLELLVVVAIIAIIAGGVIMSFGGVQDESSLQIVQSEMLEIKKAVLQFKQDTGYLPKQGPFALGVDCTSPADADEEHFCSPANFQQIYNEPVDSSNNPVMPWNINTSRGWRGPYLTQVGEGLVDVGDDLGIDGTGNPASGTVIPEVRGVADPFVSKPAGQYFVWRPAPNADCVVAFGAGAKECDPPAKWGRPYFLFDLDKDDARIVGMGSSRTYDNTNDGDNPNNIVLHLLK